MQRKFPAPLITLVITFLIFLGILSIYKKLTDHSQVRGSSTSIGSHVSPGIGILVTSESGTWNMFAFLCKDKEECNESLESGARMVTYGGGATERKEILLESKDDWKEYEFIKVYIKPGWGSKKRVFNPELENVPISMENLKGEEETCPYILIPVESVMNDFYRVALFSDRTL